MLHLMKNSTAEPSKVSVGEALADVFVVISSAMAPT